MTLIPEHINQLVDGIRLAVTFVAVLVFSLSFFVPLFRTYIPYWRTVSQPSGAMTSRLLLRFSLLALAINEFLFSYARLFLPDFDRVYLRELVVILYALAVIAVIFSWHKHPDEMRGL